MEVFKEIKEHPNYEISNNGRVRNKETKKTLCPHIAIDKYKHVRSCNVRLNKIHCRIHRLVADAFIPNPENKPVIDHIDRDPSNNHISNLRWATFKENANNRNKPIALHSHNKSGYTNILYDNKSRLWRIQFVKEGKTYHYGYYDTIEEAKKAKDSGSYEFKKRFAKGEHHHNSKLKDIDIMEMRVLYGFGIRQNKIAKQFNIGSCVVSGIVKGKTWKHVKFLI
jgi:hypothetical protein